MVLECLTWIPCTWDQLVSPFIFCKKGSVRSLSDDITIEILSRLPADCVLECRKVCRKWRALTSSPSFVELHLKRATTTHPSLFLHWLDFGSSSSPSKKHGELNFFVYDKVGQKANSTKRIITKVLSSSGKEMYHYGAKVIGSCDGLIMFIAICRSATAFVFNPVTQELISIPCPYAFTSPCGIYFHPSTREYKLLLCAYNKDLNLPQDYYTYSLKSKVWKNLNYSSYCRTTTGHPPAILLNGSVHWIVYRYDTTGNNNDNDDLNPPCKSTIMVFGTKTEDFRVLPHPGDACKHRQTEHNNMHLLGTRDHLCLCHVSWGEEINVWVLQDYANWGWARRYKVNLDWDVKRFPFGNNPPNCPSYDPKSIKVLGIHNGEILIYWESRGLFSYNLEQNTVGKVVIKVEGCNTPSPFASVYTKSLISLTDISGG